MKSIKVKILGHPLEDTFGYSYLLLSKLKQYYNVELSESPEYLFFHDSTFEHYKYDNCIKIFYTGENISPNFNECDYAISFDYLTFEDRHYRFPLYFGSVFYSHEELEQAGKDYFNKNTLLTKDELAKKNKFCSFVYSNYRAEKERKLMFDILSTYKQVSAGGSYLNNMDGVKVQNKLKFDWDHKFSVAFENSSRSGYTTEKLVSALIAKTIPIYWGNPAIGKEFNTKRFINCHDYASFEEVLERIKEIDNDDELFLKIVNEPIVSSTYNFNEVAEGLDIFLKKIIDQPLEAAKRRTINPVKALEIKRYGMLISNDVRKRAAILKVIAMLYRPFKKIHLFEQWKHSFFKSKK